MEVVYQHMGFGACKCQLHPLLTFLSYVIGFSLLSLSFLIALRCTIYCYDNCLLDCALFDRKKPLIMHFYGNVLDKSLCEW